MCIWLIIIDVMLWGRFLCPHSENAQGSLTLSGNVLYRMMPEGGVNGLDDGMVFSINTDGSGYKDLLDFTGVNGANPYGSLTLSGSILYGMTSGGGANGDGGYFHMI